MCMRASEREMYYMTVDYVTIKAVTSAHLWLDSLSQRKNYGVYFYSKFEDKKMRRTRNNVKLTRLVGSR